MTDEPNIVYSDRLAEAFAYSLELHRKQARKGSGVPYFTHLMGVASLVGEHGGSEDQVIAALLHDAVEDQGGQKTLETIRERFGDRVAGYVAGCTDADEQPKPPWRERKEAYVGHLQDLSPENRLIVASDKLHNLRSILQDYHEVGAAVWDRFKPDQEETVWYYRSVLEKLKDGWDHPILRELGAATEALEEL